MKLRAIYAALALACSFGSANAAVTINGTGWTSSIPGFDNLVSAVSFTEVFPGVEQATFAFTLPDGFSAPSFSLLIDALNDVAPDFQYVARFSFEFADVAENGGISFSSSNVGYTFNGVTKSTTSVTPWLPEVFSASYVPVAGKTLTLSDVYFGAGKGLSPSPDSSCASLSCMVPYTTKAVLNVSLTVVTAVPEPSSYGLALAGLVVVGALARRSRKN